jgi:large subunit ribosomal protein L10
LNREEKQQLVEDLRDRFAKAAVVILTDYKGLNVPMMSDLRRRLREQEVEFKVVKNTLMARAAQETPAAALGEHFRGPGAVAIGYRDPVAPAKILTKFIEDTKRLEIKLGVLNGRLIDAEGVKALAALPAREVLLGQLLAAMVAVPTGLVRVLAGVPRGLLNVLTAIEEQKAAGPPAAA